jgi:hypothetical protein
MVAVPRAAHVLARYDFSVDRLLRPEEQRPDDTELSAKLGNRYRDW